MHIQDISPQPRFAQIRPGVIAAALAALAIIVVIAGSNGPATSPDVATASAPAFMEDWRGNSASLAPVN